MSWIIFPDRVTVDEVILAIAATPNEGCWLHFDPDAGWYETDPETQEQIWVRAPNQVKQLVAEDERVAISHNWAEGDLTWLQNYCSGNEEIEFLESLPGDFVPVGGGI